MITEQLYLPTWEAIVVAILTAVVFLIFLLLLTKNKGEKE